MKTLLAALVLTAPAMFAGPPMICHPVEIGGARSLPWVEGSRDWNSPRADYDTKRLKGDALALLVPEAPVAVRMETLRRAAIYGKKDKAAGWELLAALLARAVAEPRNGQAWFDAGYFTETLRQGREWFGLEPGPEFAGEAWVRKARELGLKGPDVERALALIGEGRPKALRTSR